LGSLRYKLGAVRIHFEKKVLKRPKIEGDVLSLANNANILIIKDYKSEYTCLVLDLPKTNKPSVDKRFLGLRNVEIYGKYLVCLRNAKIKTKEGLLILPNGGFSLEHVHHFIDFLEESPDYFRTYDNRYNFLKGNYYSFIGFRPGAHYHMLSDFTCRCVKDLEFLPGDTKFLFPNSTSDVILDAFEALGIPRKRMILVRKNENYKIENLFWSPPSTKSGFNLPSELNLVKETILNNLMKTQIIDTKEKNNLYISRNDAKRKIINENELIKKVLNPNLFVIAELSKLSFIDQVRLFYNAKTIISPHGAGLVNLMFCKPGTKVLELFPEEILKGGTCYWSLSNILKLDYTYIKGKSNSEPYYESDFEVEISEVDKWLNAN